MRPHSAFWLGLTSLVLISSLGCSIGRLIAGSPEEVVALPTRTARPTFTPTPAQPTDTPLPPTATLVPAELVPTRPAPEPTPVPPSPTPSEPTPTPLPPTPTLPPVPFVRVSSDRVNVRSGPSTAYGLAGQVAAGQQMDIVAKNPAGDWWQVCCVDGSQVWIVGRLVEAQGDLAGVPVAANIAPPPPTATRQPTNTPPPPTPTVPSYAFIAQGIAEARPSTNPWVTVWGKLYDRTGKMAVEGRTVRVARGGVKVAEAVSTYAEAAPGGWSWNNPGLENQFQYNVKVEVPSAPAGVYEVYIVSGDQQVSEPISFTVTEQMREFIVAWKEK